jgi:hypothetical protein
MVGLTAAAALANYAIDVVVPRFPLFWNDWALLIALSLDLPLILLLVIAHEQFERDRRSGMLEQLSAAGVQTRHYYAAAADLIFGLLVFATIIELAVFWIRERDMRDIALLASTFIASVTLVYASLALFLVMDVLRLPMWLMIAFVWAFCAAAMAVALWSAKLISPASGMLVFSTATLIDQSILANWVATAVLPVAGVLFEGAAVWIEKRRSG